MTQCNSQIFTSQPIGKLIWHSSMPMFGAIFVLLAYDLLESSLLAFQNEELLAAFGFTLPITTAMTALAIGLSIRANNKVVHQSCIDKGKLAQEVSQSLLICMLVVSGFALLFTLFSEQLLALTGNSSWKNNAATAEAVIDQSNYMDLRYLGWPLLAIIWQVNSVLRALGWAHKASILMFSWIAVKAVIAIIVLTPQSPYFSEQLTTVAYVHLLSDGVFCLVSLLVLNSKVTLTRPTLSQVTARFSAPKTDSILVVSQQFITPVSMAALTAIAASVDTSYVAALALLFRLEVLFLLLPMVLTTSMPAIIGANFWLGNKERVKKAYAIAFSFIVIAQTIIAFILLSQGNLLSSFVCPHETIANHLQSYLFWVPWGYGAAGIAIVFQSCLNAKNMTVQATIVGFSHRILLMLPLTALGAFAFDDYGFYQGLLLGHLGSIIAVYVMFKKLNFLASAERQQDSTAQLEKT